MVEGLLRLAETLQGQNNGRESAIHDEIQAQNHREIKEKSRTCPAGAMRVRNSLRSKRLFVKWDLMVGGSLLRLAEKHITEQNHGRKSSLMMRSSSNTGNKEKSLRYGRALCAMVSE
jgi:hypothetical protein